MDLDIYTTEMSKSVWDKAFFMDKIPGAKCIIDFGCADGAMVRFLAPLFPDIMFVGYDINEELIARARAATPFYANNVFFGNYKDVLNFVHDKYAPDEICINFSSVLHEVFSSTPDGKLVIATMINAFNPKYITIRDMYFAGKNKILPYSCINYFIENTEIDRKYIDIFEMHHGSICNLKGFLHFLMKYQWKDNGWAQELKEDYFSWNINDFLKRVNYEHNYEVIFETHYLLPYYNEQWQRNLNTNEMKTHAQFVLRRK